MVARAGVFGAALVAAAAAGVGGWSLRNLRSAELGRWRIARVGYREQSVMINDSMINYGRGPDLRRTTGGSARPPLLLIHGQGADWQQQYRVLPTLAEDRRVFAVDVHGHGRSARQPEKYAASAVGADLATFVEQVVGEPVVVAGHSSGGQLAAWLGGHRPDLVRGVLLEDPPLFTTLLPRAERTWNWVDLATSCHHYLQASADGDWPAYHFAHQRMWQFFGSGQRGIVRSGLKRHRRHPDRPITAFFMPPGWNDLQRTIRRYDPRFGDAFYTGAWDVGFDHRATLQAIEAPTVLIHANWTYDDDGILQGAMDDRDANRVAALIRDVELVDVDSGHDVHGEHPRDYLAALRSLDRRIG